MSRHLSKYDLEQAKREAERLNLRFTEYIGFKNRLDALMDEERKLYDKIVKIFAQEEGDEFLALQIVEDYDMETVNELVADLEPTGIKIIELSKSVLERVRPKIIEVEADEGLKKKYDPGNPPF